MLRAFRRFAIRPKFALPARLTKFVLCKEAILARDCRVDCEGDLRIGVHESHLKSLSLPIIVIVLHNTQYIDL